MTDKPKIVAGLRAVFDDVSAPDAGTDVEALGEHWRVFREHHPVGAYLPVGQLDGDCKCGRGSWPCETVAATLAEAGIGSLSRQAEDEWDEGQAVSKSWKQAVAQARAEGAQAVLDAVDALGDADGAGWPVRPYEFREAARAAAAVARAAAQQEG
jgi:hypothetical protein